MAHFKDQYSVFILSHIVSIQTLFFCFSETHMIYLTMYNDDQKYSSCVCLDENPEMDKKKHRSLTLEITKILNLSNSSLKTCSVPTMFKQFHI